MRIPKTGPFLSAAVSSQQSPAATQRQKTFFAYSGASRATLWNRSEAGYSCHLAFSTSSRLCANTEALTSISDEQVTPVESSAHARAGVNASRNDATGLASLQEYIALFVVDSRGKCVKSLIDRRQYIKSYSCLLQ